MPLPKQLGEGWSQSVQEIVVWKVPPMTYLTTLSDHEAFTEAEQMWIPYLDNKETLKPVVNTTIKHQHFLCPLPSTEFIVIQEYSSYEKGGGNQ